MGEGTVVYRERDHWGNPGVDGRTILGRTFRKRDVD
jgi:hypothetical protein